jgi:beta-xylosidase
VDRSYNSFRLAFLCVCSILPACALSEETTSGNEDAVPGDEDATPGDEQSPDSGPTITYLPHTVLDIPAEQDLLGLPDIADPHVIKVNGTWYLYATNTKRNLSVWSSDDLSTWKRHGPIWEPTPGTWNEPFEVWAPHVQVEDDGYYLYYTANRMIGVAFAENPLGPFVDLLDHPLVGGGYGGVGDGSFEYVDTETPLFDFEEFAIDAFILAGPSGERTFYCTNYLPLSVIRATPMLGAAEVDDSGWQVLAEPDVHSWEGLVNEGTFVLEHGGTYHLMYSGNGADLPEYGLGIAVGSSPLGPFAKRDDNPFLHANPEASFFGPGHHGVVEGAFGDLLMFYHTKVGDAQEFNRRIRYVPLSFLPDGELSMSVAQP